MTCSRSQQALSEVTAASKALVCNAFTVKFLYSALCVSELPHGKSPVFIDIVRL